MVKTRFQFSRILFRFFFNKYEEKSNANKKELTNKHIKTHKSKKLVTDHNL